MSTVWIVYETDSDYYAQPEPVGVFLTDEEAKAAWPEVDKWERGKGREGLTVWTRDDEDPSDWRTAICETSVGNREHLK